MTGRQRARRSLVISGTQVQQALAGRERQVTELVE